VPVSVTSSLTVYCMKITRGPIVVVCTRRFQF
jgi:hypothetical protein